MDKEEIEKSIQERFKNLQPEIQAAIMDSNYEKNLYEIAQKHKLNVEQMGQLEFNTTLVLLGQTHPDEYGDELIEDLKLPKEKVDEIVTDVNEKIMKNIRELIKENFARDDEEEEAQSEVPLPPYSPLITESVDETPEIEPAQEPIKTEVKESTSPIVTPLSKTESGIYEKAGIEMIGESKKEEDITESIIGNKLTSPVITKPIISDHSLPKIGSQPTGDQAPIKEVTPTKPHDPYHEAIE